MTRAKLLRREGGTARSEKSVEDGLDWIVRHQRADGSWSLNFQDQCQGFAVPAATVRCESDTAATGLALLPLLGAGHIHTVKSRYQDSVRRGLEWLIAHQQPDGDLFIGPPGWPICTATRSRTMAICEAYGLSGDPSLKRPPSVPIQFICQLSGPRRRRLALFSRPAGRHLGLRLAHLRPAERPSRRDQGPCEDPEGVLPLSRSGRRPEDG